MKPILCVIIILVSLANPILAETTFFDEENEAFIVGAATPSETAGASTANTQITPEGKKGGGSCPPGQKLSNRKCMRIINASAKNETKEINVFKKNFSRTPGQFEEAEAQVAVATGPSIPTKTKESLPLRLTIIGIALIFSVYFLRILKKKKKKKARTR